MNPNLHITVATITERDGKFLLVEEKAAGKIVLNQPAGHVENGESLIAAAKRETYEETGWHVEPQAVISFYRWRAGSNGDTFFRISFLAQLLSFDAEHKLDTGIIRALWLDKTELQQQQTRLRSPMVLRCVEDYLEQKRYPLELLVDL